MLIWKGPTRIKFKESGSRFLKISLDLAEAFERHGIASAAVPSHFRGHVMKLLHSSVQEHVHRWSFGITSAEQIG